MEKYINSFIDVIRLYAEEDKIYRDYAIKCGLSVTSFWILEALYREKRPLSQKEVCDELIRFPKQTVNSAVKKLIEDLFIVQKPVANAGNSKALELTESGIAFCDKHMALLIKAENSAYALLTKEEQDKYIEHFKLMNEKRKKELGL